MIRAASALLLLVALSWAPSAHASLEDDCVWQGGVWAPTVWEADVWDETCGGSQVAVPNVIGQASFAAADAILEGVGLDGLQLADACSPAAAGVIVGQNPDAGIEVDLATVVGVVPSSGMACPAPDGLASPAGLTMPAIRF